MNKRFILGLIISVVVPFCVACDAVEATKKIVKVIADPDVPVGEPSDQPSVITINAFAAAEVNKAFDTDPAPIVFRILALSSDHRLFSFDFFSVVDDTKNTLGVTLLEELDENMLEPDSYKILGPYELPKRTKKIAVVAEYLDIDIAIWRSSLSVEDIGADDKVLLLLLEDEAKLIKEDG